MAIVNINIGNLTFKVKNLKNILAIGEELDKEKNFQKGYKHNVEIEKKNMVKAR
jgi:hypothetical protein